MRQTARTALLLAAITVLGLAGAAAQAPGQSGPSASPPSTPEQSKPAEATPSGSAGSPSDSDSQSVTLEALMREGFEVRTTTFIPADAVTRQSGKVSSDAIVMTLQKTAATAVCFYTLKAYVSKRLGTIPACVAHR